MTALENVQALDEESGGGPADDALLAVAGDRSAVEDPATEDPATEDPATEDPAAVDPAGHSPSAHVRPLDPVRYLDSRVETTLPALLLGSAVPLGVEDLVRAWRASDDAVDASVPHAAVREAVEAWSLRSGVVLDDGRIGLVDRAELPDPWPWTDAGMPFAVDAEPLSRGVSGWPGDWGHLIGAVAAAVRPAQFRSMHIAAADRFGGACDVDVAVVDLGRTVAVLTSSDLICSRRTLTSLERGHWWFWDAAASPALEPRTRQYGPEVAEGQRSRCVNAATLTRAVGEAVALLLLAANLDKQITLTVSIDEGPETLSGRSAEQWARTAEADGTVRCVECGRPLTDAESASRGFGPGCWERLGPQGQAELERLVLPLRWRGGTGWAYPLTVSAFGAAVSQT